MTESKPANSVSSAEANHEATHSLYLHRAFRVVIDRVQPRQIADFTADADFEATRCDQPCAGAAGRQHNAGSSRPGLAAADAGREQEVGWLALAARHAVVLRDEMQQLQGAGRGKHQLNLVVR